ncbi:MAG: cupredoxin domain-containing protein [Phenylobacterium sp.]
MRLVTAALAALVVGAAAAANADPQVQVVTLTLKDHRFTPDRITVAAGQKIRVELANQDAASEEFDSEDLGVEKDVTPHGKVSFVIGPLKPGTYSFMGELHADTAQGRIEAKPAG